MSRTHHAKGIVGNIASICLGKPYDLVGHVTVDPLQVAAEQSSVQAGCKDFDAYKTSTRLLNMRRADGPSREGWAQCIYSRGPLFHTDAAGQTMWTKGLAC